MKIAMPTRGELVDEHFGHCEFFTIFTMEDGSIASREELTPPPGCGCKSDIIPVLREKGVSVMLAGNMGQGAVNLLGQHGIEVVRGCSGNVDSVLASFLQGQVKDQNIQCDHDCDNH